MKRYVFLLLLFIPIFVFSQITGQIGIDEKELKIEKTEEYDKILWGQDYIIKLGMPELPIVYKSYVVPMDAKDFNLQIRIKSRRKIDGNFLIYPVQPLQTNGLKSEIVFTKPDSLVYNSSFPFPNKQFEIISDKIIQGYRVIGIIFYPVEYIPKVRNLYLYDFSFNIDYAVIPENRQLKQISAQRAKLAQTFVRSIVENPQDVDVYTDHLNIIPESTNLNGSSTATTLKLNNAIEEVIPDYVIITNNNLKRSFQKLADWKIKKGIPTVIKTVEEIDKDYSGSDLVEKIRSYLLDAKKRWNENSLFILIGGDSDIVPTRLVIGEVAGEGLIATDACYVANEFKWDINNNSLISNNVISSYLGRIPVKNSAEADTFINKLLST